MVYRILRNEMIKINTLEAHDRYLQFVKQSDSLAECIQNIINQRPYGNHPFYIFVHSRTVGMDEKISLYNDDLYKSITDPSYVRKFKDMSEVPEARIIWQPRLTKPSAQTNSMLFKAYPGSDNVKIIWMIPKKELWEQFEKGKVTESNETYISIQNFIHHKDDLEAPEQDDLSDEQINQIYREISQSANHTKVMDNLWLPK